MPCLCVQSWPPNSNEGDNTVQVQRQFRFGLALTVTLLGGVWRPLRAADLPATVTLVKDGAALALIVPAEPEDAATTLGDAVQASTHVRLPTASATPAPGKIRIHVGRSAYVDQHVPGLERMDRDGFVIAFPDARNIIIAGPSPDGTFHGVCEFLERYLGVRWLFPGELGDHVPEHAELQIPTAAVKDEPAFPSRYIYWSQRVSPENTREQILRRRAWRRRLRSAPMRLSFNHSIYGFLRPTVYGADHPEYYPFIKGTRFVPETDTPHHWEPCFTNRETAEESINRICAYFTAHADVTSFSLAVNDNGGHCGCVECLARDSGERNEVGMPNRSQSYFEWTNSVAAGVGARFPGKPLGCLAYREVHSPPTGITLNPRIVPFSCKDRYVWVDADAAAQDQQLTREWGKVATTLGWWDYPWGNTYLVPRIWFHKMAEIYRFGLEHKVAHIFSEADVTEWIEGPKFYLAARLKWDPYQDVDAILDDWYTCAVGAASAPYLRSYFAFWEDYWCVRIPQTEWFQRTQHGVYMPPHQVEGYITPLKLQELRQCEQWLSAAIAHAATDKQKARAQHFLDQFLARKPKVLSLLGDAEQISRLETLLPLTGERLLFAVHNYKKWQRLLPSTTFTEALNLKAGLLLARAGQANAWRQAFADSAWGDSEVEWFTAFVGGVDPSALGRTTITAAKTAVAPTLDGVLSEPCWQTAEKATDFRHLTEDTLVTQPTVVSVCYDAAHLYLAYCCLAQDPGTLAGNVTTHDGPIWEDDSIEFFAVPEGAGAEYCQIIASVTGAVYDTRGSHPENWNPDLTVKTTVGERFWVAEIALPFADLGVSAPASGMSLRVNFNRSGGPRLHREISGWQFVDGRNNNVSRFGTLVLE